MRETPKIKKKELRLVWNILNERRENFTDEIRSLTNMLDFIKKLDKEN